VCLVYFSSEFQPGRFQVCNVDRPTPGANPVMTQSTFIIKFTTRSDR
jgi:hypothetical protein